MRTPKKVTESELFRKLNILLLDKNKEHLEIVKEKASLFSNVEIDNSGFFRGVIEYFHENEDELLKLAPYIRDAKGYNILQRFIEMMAQNKTPKQISDELGIGLDISAQAHEKYLKEN